MLANRPKGSSVLACFVGVVAPEYEMAIVPKRVEDRSKAIASTQQVPTMDIVVPREYAMSMVEKRRPLSHFGQ